MDFCCELLGTKVSATQVSSDGHEVTNLISANARAKAAGFIAERFIKPPVDIEFILPCEIQLNYIYLVTSVGGQRSSGIDIASFVNRSNRPVSNNSTDISKSASSEIVEIFLGKCLISSETENQVVFINRSFMIRAPFNHLPSTSVPTVGISKIMKLTHMDGVNKVMKIKIRLWKTTDGRVPTLGKVIINGIPARQVSVEIIQRLLKIVEQDYGTRNVEGNTSQVANQQLVKIAKAECSKDKLLTKQSTLVIPDDFLDSITCEVMSYPLVLPSGNIIDQTTLDKHISAEAVWGRPASDPFTGLSFTTQRKPIPNLALKSRIDQFLLKNFESIPSSVINGHTTGKRKRDDSLPSTSFNSTQDGEECAASDGANHCDISNSSKSVHELELKRSLNDALRNVLGYTSCTNAKSKTLTMFDSNSTCSSCNTATKNKSTFYRLPCKHEICRSCIRIQEKTTIDDPARSCRCPLCKSSFRSSDIQRIH